MTTGVLVGTLLERSNGTLQMYSEERHEVWPEAADAATPLGRLLVPDDIAPMVTYLLSDSARMVTGAVIDFDQTVHGPYGPHMTPAHRGEQ